MADKLHKVGDPIEIGYQAPGAVSSLIVKADIYDQNKALTLLGGILSELGNTGTYRGEFIPGAIGTWQVVMYIEPASGERDSQVTKSYSVGGHNVHSVGEAVSTVDSKVVEVGGAIGSIQDKVDEIDTEVDALTIQVDGMDDQLDTVETKIDSIESKVSALDTPPMAF